MTKDELMQETRDPGAADVSAACDGLRDRATAGEEAAMTPLGGRPLTGRDAARDRDAAANCRAAAVRPEDPAPIALSATRTATTEFGPPDWTAALDDLARVAAGGSADARGRLCLLSGACEPHDSLDPFLWRGGRDQIDLQAWRAAPSRLPPCERPRVRIAENFSSPQVCDWLRSRVQGECVPH